MTAARRAALRAALVEAGRGKPVAPYTLDEAMTFFCPQENVEGLDLPLVRDFQGWVREEHEPSTEGDRAILLLLPCQPRKPYALAPEHLAINGALLAAGFAPTGRGDWPKQLDTDVAPELRSNAPLLRDGLRIDRAVISEPFGLVPYEAIYHWHGVLSPCARYDDPGLFEHRGLGAPWREDSTSVARADGTHRWGDAERAAYVEAHNRLATEIAAALERLASHYDAIVSYTTTTLTHRSFLADHAGRRAVRLPNARTAGGVHRRLVGVNDLVPGLVEILPAPADLDALRAASGRRLPQELLSDPLLLDRLVARVDALAAA
ncbi:hypothetical protein [Conexibacter woesei]|uniref:Uncharacterized protein n=1 Tax=Conexibacter woesei (strain DSM 14684 / CCUG 47730 / CIP 108061 / JCM 11494 / NBRC 100937 / ID131577) TaxID=469383 RepID=D3F6V6_CONWI|nr:hypothetical protein [Conexibacter woesei]ADB52754.1 hypothetical protein Cwoe_4340 [Conexibacter woesei DSM 14684]